MKILNTINLLLLIPISIFAQTSHFGIKVSDIEIKNNTDIDTLLKRVRKEQVNQCSYNLFHQFDNSKASFSRVTFSFFQRSSLYINTLSGIDSIYSSNQKDFNKVGFDYAYGKNLSYNKFTMYGGFSIGLYKMYPIKLLAQQTQFHDKVKVKYYSSEIKGFSRYYEIHAGFFVSLNYQLTKRLSIGSELSQAAYINYTKDNTTVETKQIDYVTNQSVTKTDSNSNYKSLSIYGNNIAISFLLRYSIKHKPAKLQPSKNQQP